MTAVAEETKGKKGAKKVYASLAEVESAIVAAGGTVETKELTKDVKQSDGTVKTYTQTTKEVDCPNLNAMLAAVNNDEGQMCSLFTRAVNNVFQAADRVALANKALGAAVSAAKSVRSLLANNIPEDIAISTVVTLLAAQGTMVSAEEIKGQL